jgi:O-antigen ligase
MTSLAYGALWIFVFSIPWEGVVASDGVAVVSRLTGLLAVSLALLACVTSGRLRRWHAFHVAALLFVVWAGCVVIILRIANVPNKLWTFVQLFLVVWMIWEIAGPGRRLLGLLMAYVLGAYVAALDTILVYRREGAALRRFAAGGVDPNDLAMTLVLALPMAWYLGMTYRKPLLRWVFRGYIPVGLVAIGLTGSRGGMLATIVALLIVPLTMTRMSPGKFAVAAATLAISGVLAVAYVPDTIVQRLGTIGTQVQDLSVGGRFKLWKAGMNAFAQSPLIGYSPAGYKRATTPWLGDLAQVAHNSFISVLVEEGLVGLLLFLSMLLTVYFAVRRLPLLERRLALVELVTLVVAMLPLTWEDRKSVWVILAVLVGMSQAFAAGRGGVVPQPQPGRIVPRSRLPIEVRRGPPLGSPGMHAGRDQTE